MALKLHKVLDGHVPPILYLPASNGGSSATYVAGQAMVFSGGQLVAVKTDVGQDTDEGTHYVCMEVKTIAAAGDPLGVVKADEQMIWEIPNSAADTDLTVGAAYDLHTDGLSITDAITTAGCFTVLETDGNSAGDMARGILV